MPARASRIFPRLNHLTWGGFTVSRRLSDFLADEQKLVVPMSQTELNCLKVTELKQRLEGLGLDKKGKKAELVARLLATSATATTGRRGRRGRRGGRSRGRPIWR